MANDNAITKRLLAHARLCRQMADQTISEEIARELRKLAEECARAAREASHASLH